MAPATDLKNLDIIVESSISLLSQLQVALAEIHRNPNAPTTKEKPDTDDTGDGKPSKPVDAIALARDSASLVRAHSTKLSLLMINEPFTPSAIIKVLRDLTGGPLPGLAASLEECQPERYTAVFRKELAWRCRAVLVELGQLLSKMPSNGQALSSSQQGFEKGEGSVALTGMVWSACDDVTKLTNLAVGGFFVQKVGEWRDTLKDVMEELKEWGDEEAEDDEDEDEGDAADALADQLQDTHISSTQDMIDDLMNTNTTIPKSDPDRIRPRLESSLKRLRLVTLLYTAVIKRRIKKLPQVPPPGDATESAAVVPQRLDEVAEVLKIMPDRFGDLACAFYELESEEIDSLMDQCFLDAFAASELLSKAWDGGKDEFTEWAEKFQAEIKKE